MNIPFIKYSKLFLILSAVIFVASVAVTLRFGLKLGIDFTGGSLLELSWSGARPDTAAVAKVVAEAGWHNSVIQKSGERNYLIRTEFLTEEAHQKLLAAFRQNLASGGETIQEIRIETIGATVSSSLRRRTLWAIIFVNLSIIGYVAYAFRRVSKPVASWQYGVLGIVALLHDVWLVIGVFVLLGHWRGVEVDIAFVVALLTTFGYSMNDTIVVYDRIRENLLRRTSESFAMVVNRGLNETLWRSINTTLTTLLPLGVLYFFGGSSIRYFALALFIGIASGAYSSIFIASPLLVMVEERQRKRAV